MESKETVVLNGGQNAAGNPTSYRAGVVKTLQDPTRSGYTFLGWKQTCYEIWIAVQALMIIKKGTGQLRLLKDAGKWAVEGKGVSAGRLDVYWVYDRDYRYERRRKDKLSL